MGRLRELSYERVDKILAMADATMGGADKIPVYDISAGLVKMATLTQVAVAMAGTNASDVAYDATTWDGVTTFAASKNAIRDKVVLIDAAMALRTIVTQVTATLAEINAEKVLIAGTVGKKIVVTNISAVVAGTFTTGTAVVVEDETGNDVISYAVAAVTDGALLLPSTTNVTPAATGFGVALTVGEDLVVIGTGSAMAGGTSIAFTISHVLVD